MRKRKDQAGSAWETATAGVTVDEALRLMEPTARVTDEVKAAVAAQLTGTCSSVAEVAGLSPLVLAVRLIGTPLIDEDDLVDIARDLIAGFRAELGQPADAARPEPEPEPEPRGKAPRPRAAHVALSEEECRRLLFSRARPREDAMSGSICLEAGEILESFSSMSGSVRINGGIVLRSSSTMSGSIHGEAYVPPGTRFSTMSGAKRVRVHVESYQELVRRAGLA